MISLYIGYLNMYMCVFQFINSRVLLGIHSLMISNFIFRYQFLEVNRALLIFINVPCVVEKNAFSVVGCT